MPSRHFSQLDLWGGAGQAAVSRAMVREAQMRHLGHQPPRTRAAWLEQRDRLRAAIRERAGSFPPPPPLDLLEHGRVTLDGYTLRKVSYQSRPGLRVTANLYLPDGKGPFPGVLNVHGHWAQGKIAARVQKRGHVLARSGFAVLSVDAFGAGERGTVPGRYEYHGHGIGGALFAIGETLLGMQVYDNQRGLDLLGALPEVDAGRLGVTGASGGGNQTMWLAALDPRVKAACPVVSVGTFESYVTSSNCVCEVLPDGLALMEEWAVLGLVAPRPLLILNALRDVPCFSVGEMVRSFNGAREVYRLLGAGDRMAYAAIDLPHGYWDEMLSAMLGWFQRWLQGKGEGRPAPLPSVRCLPEADGLCFPDGKRPDDVASIVAYVQPRVSALRARHRAARRRIARTKQMAALRGLLRLRAPAPRLVSDVRTEPARGGTLQTFVLESEPGFPLPVAVLRPRRAAPGGTLSVVVHPAGKPAAAAHPAVAALLRAGRAVAFVDLRACGETLYDAEQDRGPAFTWPYRIQLRSALWLGRTMIGDWTTDLLAAVDHLRRTYAPRAIEVFAFAETGLAALCAAAMTPRIARTVTVDMPGSYGARGRVVARGMAACIPGILRWGDVSMMAALSRGTVEIRHPLDLTGEPYDAALCEDLQEEIRALTGRIGGKGGRCRVVERSAMAGDTAASHLRRDLRPDHRRR